MIAFPPKIESPLSTTNSNVYTSNDYGVTFILRSTITANNFGRFLEGSSVDDV